MTILTKSRRRWFERPDLAALCIAQLLRAAGQARFAVLAYTVMPDHVHLLVQGLDGTSDFRRLMKLTKQLSGYHVKQRSGRPLWADGYYDRIVRHDEDPRRYVTYILMNPVKAGLASIVADHPYTWAAAVIHQ